MDVLKALLDHGADVEDRMTTGGATAVLVAAASGHVDIVKELLDRGADRGAR